MQLFLRHEREIRGYILSMMVQWADADDVLQESCIVMWQKFSEFDPESSFSAWARKIIYFTLQNYRRKQGAHVCFSDEFLERLSARAVERDPTTDARHAFLADCMAKLRPVDRELIERRFEADRTARDLAKSLGRPAKSVYKSLNRVYRSLLACIERAQIQGGRS